MFEKFDHIIKDSDFFDGFIEQNILSKVGTNLILKKKIESDENLLDKHLKALYLQLLENYISISETALMLLYAKLGKKNDGSKSFLYYYSKIFVQEKDDSEWNTERMLEILESSQGKDLYEYFGLVKPSEVLKKLKNNELFEIEEKFGSIEKAIKQGDDEFAKIFESISKVISNRKRDIENKKLDLYKIYNKLKHGSQFIDIPNTNQIYIISKVNTISSFESSCEVYYLECTKEGAFFLAEQSKLIAQSLENLIGLISYSLQS